MAEGLPQTADLVHSMAESMERGGKAAHGMELSVGKMAASLLAVRGIEAVFDRLVLKSDTMLGIQKAFSKEQLAQVGIGTVRFNALAAAAAATADLLLKQRQFNQNLIEANSSFEHRNKLIQDTLVLQAQSGVSFDNITSAARALVHYNMDAETTFEANLEIIAKMEQGLGVSASESARLASIVERQVKGSFEGVARTIAQIVEDTALAGDEAARLATNISTALGRLRPGLGAAGLPEVVKLVGRYEGALKEVGGSAGALTQLLTQMTTPEGIVGAGALGVNPEFLATSSGVQEVMKRFADYGEMLVGQSSGWERQMRLQALAQQFNVSADQANQLMIAIKRANTQQVDNISLQERWRQQIHATNSGISRLTNAIMGLIQTGLLPVVNIIGGLTNKLADFVEFALKSKTVVYVLGTALALAAAAAASGLWQVVRALSATAIVSRLTGGSNPVALFRAQQALGLNPGMAAVRGVVMGVFNGLRAVLMSSFMWLLPLVVAAGFLAKIYQVNKDARDEQRQAQQIILSKADALEKDRQLRFYAAGRYGDADDVMKAYKGLVSDATAKFQDITDPIDRALQTNTWLKQKLAESELDLYKGMATRGMYTPLDEMTPEDQGREDEMRNLTEKMLKENERMRVLAEKDIQAKLEQSQELEIVNQKNRVWYLQGRYNPFGIASDYASTIGR